MDPGRFQPRHVWIFGVGDGYDNDEIYMHYGYIQVKSYLHVRSDSYRQPLTTQKNYNIFHRTINVS